MSCMSTTHRHSNSFQPLRARRKQQSHISRRRTNLELRQPTTPPHGYGITSMTAISGYNSWSEKRTWKLDRGSMRIERWFLNRIRLDTVEPVRLRKSSSASDALE